ncbi:MAG TPA: DUF3108 domain-containing protein [Pseudomonas xinjiangensis]|uniref:DUF3108 domain-containing protein n=2 Tax=root TaxID=1 RepID=A0A7V1FS74_9GAMM|nr:DUF3108 domain-containing protein [Halopseudomonas xinjiangensis]HEC47971.1 DUF3108 domain-containing protein [Halopseudomonas xinjiangensis]
MSERLSRAFGCRPARWLVALTLAVTSTIAGAKDLVPFTASYAADMRKVPVNGEATHSLQPNADGTWALSFNAGMFVARLTEESTLRLYEDTVQPLEYKYERRGLGRSREATLDFDWAANAVTGEYKGEQFTLDTEPGLLDKTTYQLALQRDLMAGKTDMHYRVVDGDDIEDYYFRVTGEDRVTTRVGQFNAVEVERVREAGSKRQTTLWFAKDWQYLLVRLKQIETDGQQYQIMLKEATLDGEAVTGLPVDTD